MSETDGIWRRSPLHAERPVRFGTYIHLSGYIDKASPSQRLLDVDDSLRSVWDVIDAPKQKR